MAIYIVPDVPLLPQDRTNGCWYFSAKMVAKYSRGTVKDPETVPVLKNLYDGNCGWSTKTAKDLAAHLGMDAVARDPRGPKEMRNLLVTGPVWAAGMLPQGASSFAHVVVIAGVADTGVLVLNPLPLNVGERSWKTWAWLDQFIALDNGDFDRNFLCIRMGVCN